MRYRFTSDDSGHDYLVPDSVSQDDFDAWVESESRWDDEPTYTGEDFEKYRLNMSYTNYTFTDPKER